MATFYEILPYIGNWNDLNLLWKVLTNKFQLPTQSKCHIIYFDSTHISNNYQTSCMPFLLNQEQPHLITNNTFDNKQVTHVYHICNISNPINNTKPVCVFKFVLYIYVQLESI